MAAADWMAECFCFFHACGYPVAWAFISNHHSTFLLFLRLPFFFLLSPLSMHILFSSLVFSGLAFLSRFSPILQHLSSTHCFLSCAVGRTSLLKPSGKKLLLLFSPLLCFIPQRPLSELCHQGPNSNQLSCWNVLLCRHGHLSHVNLSNFFYFF